MKVFVVASMFALLAVLFSVSFDSNILLQFLVGML